MYGSSHTPLYVDLLTGPWTRLPMSGYSKRASHLSELLRSTALDGQKLRSGSSCPFCTMALQRDFGLDVQWTGVSLSTSCHDVLWAPLGIDFAELEIRAGQFGKSAWWSSKISSQLSEYRKRGFQLLLYSGLPSDLYKLTSLQIAEWSAGLTPTGRVPKLS